MRLKYCYISMSLVPSYCNRISICLTSCLFYKIIRLFIYLYLQFKEVRIETFLVHSVRVSYTMVHEWRVRRSDRFSALRAQVSVNLILIDFSIRNSSSFFWPRSRVFEPKNWVSSINLYFRVEKSYIVIIIIIIIIFVIVYGMGQDSRNVPSPGVN